MKKEDFLDDKGEWVCIPDCGACCIHSFQIGCVPGPEWVRPDNGQCVKFDPEAKSCTDYENRPADHCVVGEIKDHDKQASLCAWLWNIVYGKADDGQ